MITTDQAVAIATKPENILWAGLSRSHLMNLCVTCDRMQICWKRDRVIVPVNVLYHSSLREAHYRMILDRETGEIIERIRDLTTDFAGQPVAQ